MRALIKKILKEEISGRHPDKQQKLYDYIVKEVVNSIQIKPHYITYENIDAMLDDDMFDSEITSIVNNPSWGWQKDDDMLYTHESSPQEMSIWLAKSKASKQMMDIFVKEGKYRQLRTSNGSPLMAPDAGWVSTIPDYHLITPDLPVKIDFSLWYNPFNSSHYPHDLRKSGFETPLIIYLRNIYGIVSIEEFEKLFTMIKKGLVDRIKDLGIILDNDKKPTKYLYETVIDDFVGFTKNELGLGDDFSVELDNDGEELETLASYDIEDNKVRVLSKNRSIPDIIRSIAHELVHHKQNQKGELTGDEEEGADGSPQENEANAKAGEIVRKFGRENPEVYDL